MLYSTPTNNLKSYLKILLKLPIANMACMVVAFLFGLSSLIYIIGVDAAPNSDEPRETPSSPQFSASIVATSRQSNFLIVEPSTQKVFASIPRASDPGGNSIVRVDPGTGQVEQSVWIGSDPGKVALANDGRTLYVNLDGSRSLRRFDILTGNPGPQFSFGYHSIHGQPEVADFAISPTDPNVVAVSRKFDSTSAIGGVAIFDNGIQRPATSGESRAITFGTTENILYGHTFYSSELQRMSITSSGVASITNFQGAAGDTIEFSQNRLYSSIGKVRSPDTGAEIGTFVFPDGDQFNKPFALDTASSKIFFASRASGGLKIYSYDLNTFVLLGTVVIGGVYEEARCMARWGTNGLAISVANSPTIYVRTDLVGDGPIGTSVPLPTPTPTPVVSTFVREVALQTNDIVVNPTNDKIYATFSGVIGPGLGNTISRIDPTTGNVEQSVFVGSEPNMLVRTEDSTSMFVRLGQYNVRQFDLTTNTPGTQFNVPNGNFPISDLLPLPGSPNSVVVSTGSGGIAIYENGVMRPTEANTSGSMLARGSANDVIYNCSPYSPTNLESLGVTASGLTLVSSFRGAFRYGCGEIRFHAERLYTSSGQVIDPATAYQVGQFSIPGQNYGGDSFTIDTALNRLYIAKERFVTVFDLDTYNVIGSIRYAPNNSESTFVSSLSRWGQNGLVLRTAPSSGTSKLIIIQSSAVSDSGTIPTGFALEQTSQVVGEGNSPAIFRIARTGDTNATHTVSYTTVNGTAIANSDYIPMVGSVTFNPGEISKTISVPITWDNVYEGFETFGFQITGATGPGANVMSPSTATATIADDDVRPNITSTNRNTIEPSSGQSIIINLEVRLSNPSVETVSVNYQTVDGTALAGVDYISTNGTLTYAPLETVKNISIQVLGDVQFEPSEFFTVGFSNPVNAGWSIYHPTITIQNFNTNRRTFDFDGDAKTDIGIYRPNGAIGSEWWLQRSSNGSNFAVQFGAPTDKVAAADYTGDGKTDVAFWRPSTGFWYVLRSEDLTFYGFPFGANGDTPVPADYDADGKADVAVFRESATTWYIQRSSDGGTTIQGFGAAGDVPVNADYDGDGKADIAIYRPSLGQWWLMRSSAGTVAYQFGSPTDKTVVGDYTGDGKADVAFWRPSSGEWFVLRSEDNSFFGFPFGISTDTPVPGDYDGDGRNDAGVFRSSNNTWYIQRTTAGTLIQQFGATGDLPLPNAYVR